jgi:uncharacterized protein
MDWRRFPDSRISNVKRAQNVLAGVVHASAEALFVTSPQLHRPGALRLGAGVIAGACSARKGLHRVNWKALRIAICALGSA